MEYVDYYKILNIDKNASVEEIEKVYSQLAEKYDLHEPPDDKESETRFREITEARAALTDPDKRAKYDQLRASWTTHQRTKAKSDFDWSQWVSRTSSLNGDSEAASNVTVSSAGQATGFSEFFEAVFTGTDTKPVQMPPTRGEDYHQKIEITLAEAFKGASRILRIGGRRIKVRVPRGAQTGTKVRVRGEGGQSPGNGPKGDLYLEIEVMPDPIFERKGDDLHAELPVDLYTAILGGEATVPTFKGKIKLKIPPESQSGRTFRLKGQGMSRLQQPDERGDLFVKVMIHLPENLTDEEIALFEELADMRGL